jgi:hypothetical protein
MKKTSEDFVKSLKDKISRIKKQENFQRNLLQDSVEYFIGLLAASNEVEIKSIKNFETSDISCFLNLYSESENIPDTLSSILNSSNIRHKSKDIGKRRHLFLVDFGGHLISSGHSSDWFYMEFHFKGKHLFECRISPIRKTMEYHIFDKTYFSLDIWMCDHLDIRSYEVTLMSSDRNKKRIRKSLDDNYNITINFDVVGEIENVKISKKIGSKK